MVKYSVRPLGGIPSLLPRLETSNLVMLVKEDLLFIKTVEHFNGAATTDVEKLIDSDTNDKITAIRYFIDLENGDDGLHKGEVSY